MRSSGHLTTTALLSALALSASAMQAPPEKIALVGGHVIPVVGEDMPTGTILIEHGRITAIGPTVEIPYDAMEVDMTGKFLFPGMIDPHSARGLDIPNENVPVTPFLDVYDAIDPSRAFFEESLRDGVTSVHVIVGNNCVIGGVSRVVRPIGLSVDEMTFVAPVALKVSGTPRSGFDRMRQLATLREVFIDLDEYLGRLAETKYEESIKEKGETLDIGPAEARERGRSLLRDEHYDDAHENIVRLKRGDLGAWIYCGEPTDVAPMIRIATEQGYLPHSVFVLGPGTFRAVSELAEAGRPVVLDEALFHRERDPISGNITETFVPTVAHEAGLTFALQPNPGASVAERYLNYQAAMCVREGLPRQVALEAITINPARMLGLGDRVGSLEVGKVANVVVFSGDPLDFSSWVEQVYIDGILAYDRAKDHRLQKLLELEQRNAAEAQASETPAPPAEAAEPPPPGEADADNAGDDKDDDGNGGEGSGGDEGDDGDDGEGDGQGGEGDGSGGERR